ncbi:MAG: helix-turn-helix transcriptional regulator [Candidatus Nanopelagicales bacterium]
MSAFRRYIELTREHSVNRDIEQVASSVEAAVQGTGLTGAAFAELIGTSASRLSTYASGKVTPSAALMLRI